MIIKDCELNKIKKSEANLLFANGLKVVKLSIKLNNEIKCDFIQSLVDDLQSAKRLQDYRIISDLLYKAVLHKCKHGGFNMDLIELGELCDKIQRFEVHTDDMMTHSYN